MWRVGGCPDPVYDVVGLCRAYFAAEHLEGLGLVEVEVEGWGLGWSLLEVLEERGGVWELEMGLRL